ncbi:zinc finger MYND domain-containing protein 15 isoform X2 [Selaginella moellendorffii]|uniref:zinc finger MYND domain-containing protein 15 isoform X2 n=1 Tax=Selaginella moellendorffii TaxID=88036 RepID=UPI000D1CCFC9|nr:zinc finger MYND domain-containing protein 15 isoform X2 [Selaginella moellendorffii]|eukprot:XP_024520915.1 zinc finger MYND domain-containing protein 15 isoform X2 [Selaginella moellendorffii]
MDCGARNLSRCVDDASCPIRCDGCGVVWYCSRFHQSRHWSEHKLVCKRLAQQARKASSLSEFPFSFELESSMCGFLDKRGLHGKGLWKNECSCLAGASSRRDSSWHLPSNACPCKGPRNAPAAPLESWKQYYEWRDLPLHSPAAILLHSPLTLYYAINQATFDPREKLTIHYLGPERELEQLEVFTELLALLPGTQIHIDFVGPAVPSSSHGSTLELSSYPKCLDASCECKLETNHTITPTVSVSLWKGLYHDVHHQISRADFVVAFNAGIAAYITWRPTIELLLTMEVPVFVTDFCEEACVLAVECIDSLEPNHVTFPITENPFRQPAGLWNTGIDLPMHANCFIFGLGVALEGLVS